MTQLQQQSTKHRYQMTELAIKQLTEREGKPPTCHRCTLLIQAEEWVVRRQSRCMTVRYHERCEAAMYI